MAQLKLVCSVTVCVMFQLHSLFFYSEISLMAEALNLIEIIEMTVKIPYSRANQNLARLFFIDHVEKFN